MVYMSAHARAGVGEFGGRVYMPVSEGSCLKSSVLMEPELQLAVRCRRWVLETELKSSGNTVKSLTTEQSLWPLKCDF